MATVHFTVHGDAAPQGSKVRTRFGVRDDNPRTKPWKGQVSDRAAEAMEAAGLTVDDFQGPLVARFVFYRQRPKNHIRSNGEVKDWAPEAPPNKPDSLKLGRAVEDAMTGIVYKDDAQICQHSLIKLYGTPVRVEVFVGSGFEIGGLL